MIFKTTINLYRMKPEDIDDVMALDLPQDTIDLAPLPRLTLPRLLTTG